MLVTLGSTACQLAALLIMPRFWIYKAVSILIIIPAFNYLLCKERGQGSAMRMYLMSLIVTLLVGGVVYALPGDNGIYIAVALVMGYLLIAYLGRQRAKLKSLYEVSLNGGDWIMALYDSGNRLTNRSDGRGISIISDKLLEGLSCTYYGEAEYETIGDSRGRLKVYEIQNMVIRQGGKDRALGKSLLGVSEKCFDNKMYKIILNENVFND